MLEGLKGRPIGELCAEHEVSHAQYFLANAAKALELRKSEEVLG